LSSPLIEKNDLAGCRLSNERFEQLAVMLICCAVERIGGRVRAAPKLHYAARICHGRSSRRRCGRRLRSRSHLLDVRMRVRVRSKHELKDKLSLITEPAV